MRNRIQSMKTKRFSVVLVVLLTLGAAQHLAAQVLTNHSFDLVLQGDDPGEVFNFAFPFDPLVPSRVTFDGFFENLDGADTGVNYQLTWFHADRSVFLSSGGFVPLAGFGRLPLSLDQTAGFTPTEAFVHIEGGGPADHFRFVGQFAIQPVPEPSTFALLGVAAAVSLFRWLYGRKATGSQLRRS
jgi:hypothetical protein